MNLVKAIFKNAWPYQEDKMHLPVKELETSIPFYETIMGFQLLSKEAEPHKSAVLGRDGIEIGLSENGGDPGQDGCFFEVDDVDRAFAELRSNGLRKEISNLNIEQHGGVSWKVYYVVAPDGLCYCIGERQNQV